MTRTARRAALAALTALAAVAAIIAADLTPPAAAQSEEETTGRIVARRLDDGRVEFGWQPSGAARVLPRQRYFPADATVERWLRSSPVEVDGAEIGRINARLLSDGRIEFAFTPTDGERIEPPARYFPADARVNRWLRSTEIAIGPAAPRYSAVSAGHIHTCAVRESGEIACWGSNWSGQSEAPDGRFIAVSAGTAHSCAIRAASGELACWGEDGDFEQSDAPEGSYVAVSAARYHTCAIRKSGELTCWGGSYRYDPNIATIPNGSFTAVSAGSEHDCAIRTSGALACWGLNDYGESDAPEGSYIAISVGYRRTCAIRESGDLACWGRNNRGGQNDAPDDRFTSVSAGNGHTCGLRGTGEVKCWGINETTGIVQRLNEETQELEDVVLYTGQATPPEGSFIAVSAGSWHTCAIRESREIACWGLNGFGQATPPTD